MRLPRSMWIVFGAASIIFHIGLVFSGLVPNLVSRPLHMALVIPWIFLYRADDAPVNPLNLAWVFAGIGACLYIAFNHEALGDQYGFLDGNFQIVIAVVLLATTLYMARRAIGWPLPAVATITLIYGAFGQYLPGEFGLPGLPMGSYLGTLTISEGGLWGTLTAVSVSVVSIFVIFGAVLNAGEAGQGFMNLATAAAGRLTGGAAKVSVISSALFGSISGSASANVASTGAITLPAMTKLGYPRRLAGAVEAVASSGGQIMPPLMGAGAFVMVELTGVPYTGIMAAALLPAVLYFVIVWFGINGFASRYQLPALAAVDQPAVRTVVITSLFFAIPFVVLLERMLHAGYTPQYAACIAILTAFVLLFTNAELKFPAPETRQRIEDACIASGRQIALIASIILCAGIVIGVLGMTGLGVKITSLILSASGNLLWPALLLTALACLVLGMEVPTTAAYVICVSVAGPALIQLGVDTLTAHLFVFWYALLSTITPPVCGAVFIAAGMVEENWLKVSITAMALGLGLYLIPIGIIANPGLINIIETPAMAMLAFTKVMIALALISAGVIRPLKWLLRVALVTLGAGLLLVPLG
ncbi:MAG: C4-dicarboxylate ABC transporter permease [marine bacterium B5-7]|nr:MAG: C4-dicarboxylate ABC transporter permease [marine bacterium B5-7]